MSQTMKIDQIGGKVTFRRIDNGNYIMIAHFPSWRKAHAVNPSYPRPGGPGKEYGSMGECWEAAKKFMVNWIISPKVDRPLASSDKYSGRLNDSPAEETA